MSSYTFGNANVKVSDKQNSHIMGAYCTPQKKRKTSSSHAALVQGYTDTVMSFTFNINLQLTMPIGRPSRIAA